MMRWPAVVGRFYPADPKEIKRALESYLGGGPGEIKARIRGCLVPHAGYMYSGAVAGAVYRRIDLPRRIVLLGPRHFPAGHPMAIMADGEWLTPLGPAKIASDLALELMRACPLLAEDAVAHQQEHSLEVQLPFLQELAKDFTFVPIALGTTALAALEELGEAVGRVVAGWAEPVLVIASSDMNHYESDRLTRRKDQLAIEKILRLEPRGLFETVTNEGISMCGFGPAVTMLTAALRLGAKRAELVSYATSGDITGDREAVVGYAGVIVE
ncbi:MAG TPA: AmmeMemoRadiSam system protein B [Candidatus Acidoferrales bacterium]|nr:AmmeMemoRadiSam system protein B [Candidatus Acidoferrales bacterium]